MLHVTQGHERGIGLEIFFKSYWCLPSEQQKKIILHASHDEVENILHKLKLPLPSNLLIKDIKPSKKYSTQTLASLFSALEAIDREQGNLFTLPTSKDQLSYQGQHHLGYTEFLRFHFRAPHLVMSFKAPKSQIALLTDHVSLAQFVQGINSASWEQKLRFILRSASSYYGVKNLFVAGINPHAGEGGLLGEEEILFKETLSKLQQEFSHLQVVGPLPADTLHLKNSAQALLIYLYHDQGLSWFKGVHGFIGANITLGLPFIRLSVDHGTAFDLYGKNNADYRGCLFALKQGLAKL